MQNIYPIFERNRILKKEMLSAVRDYAFSHIQLEYQDYGEGILRGCQVSVEQDRLRVGTGIIKTHSFVCLMMEEETIPYGPEDQTQYLKLCVHAHKTPDYTEYKAELKLDKTEEKKTNEYELCRFFLRPGADLRDHYTSFADMETEYDTVNLIYAGWGGLGGGSMSPAITRSFARAVLEGASGNPEDMTLACLCMSQPGAVPLEPLSACLRRRTGREEPFTDSLDLYHAMRSIIGGMGGPRKPVEKKRERRMILVD